MNAIELSIFTSRLNAVCDEMGAVLQRAAFSPNIRDRLDFSCAVFDAQGELCAQAAHIPVHLGSMAFAMRNIVSQIDWTDGDMVIVNDPFLGGTHLPDVTLIAPLFVDNQLQAFVANRAHHADIGATTPGSMPLSSRLEEEGIIIPPTKLVVAGKQDQDFFKEITGATRSGETGQGDLSAQISANHSGLDRLAGLIKSPGAAQFDKALVSLNDYAERLAESALLAIPNGAYEFTDYMDDDGLGQKGIPIKARLQVQQHRVHVDFSGTAGQVSGNINCPLSVAAAAVFYVFRCLMPNQTPACAGTFRPITLEAPTGSLINAQRPAAVAAGNVETSTRIVDVVLGALAKAMPERIPAASHGSMNNLAMGSRPRGSRTNEQPEKNAVWDYYETIGGGSAAGPEGAGESGIQTHMTNTRNTPVEVLESCYPIRIQRYALREYSGGGGQYRGGDGLIREFEFLQPATVTLLTERRYYAPWGLNGGQDAQPGSNSLNGNELGAKVHVDVEAGDVLTIQTPGGGGFGLKA
ncbi:MAG: hydantoinase B/oxoprolinase family protein [Gammaproteobacteria bacterium]|nr:hydantoinase B/oxoprolinase family protein [Gammaproteobacteria bacterium]